DAGALEAAVRVVARSVRDDDLLRARLEGELDDRADDVRIRVRRVDRHAIPADVRLDDDDVAARDEPLDAAHRFDGAFHEDLGARRLAFSRLRDRELRMLRVAILQAIVADLARAAS